ncbi:MAG TPA: hypothetical protein VFQ34_06815, partial [Nitrospiraceae bacterium]|nr:hypothetical protein [Nitrospiraceae bacterium]
GRYELNDAALFHKGASVAHRRLAFPIEEHVASNHQRDRDNPEYQANPAHQSLPLKLAFYQEGS